MTAKVIYGRFEQRQRPVAENQLTAEEESELRQISANPEAHDYARFISLLQKRNGMQS